MCVLILIVIQEDPVVYLKALKQIGASSIRVDYQWNKIERTKGKYVVSRAFRENGCCY